MKLLQILGGKVVVINALVLCFSAPGLAMLKTPSQEYGVETKNPRVSQQNQPSQSGKLSQPSQIENQENSGSLDDNCTDQDSIEPGCARTGDLEKVQRFICNDGDELRFRSDLFESKLCQNSFLEKLVGYSGTNHFSPPLRVHGAIFIDEPYTEFREICQWIKGELAEDEFTNPLGIRRIAGKMCLTALTDSLDKLEQERNQGKCAQVTAGYSGLVIKDKKYVIARDTQDKNYVSEILAEKPGAILIHYLGWGSLWDEWISFDSGRLKSIYNLDEALKLLKENIDWVKRAIPGQPSVAESQALYSLILDTVRRSQSEGKSADNLEVGASVFRQGRKE